MSNIQDDTAANTQASPMEILGLANLENCDSPEALVAAVLKLDPGADSREAIDADVKALSTIEQTLLTQVVQVLRHHLYEKLAGESGPSNSGTQEEEDDDDDDKQLQDLEMQALALEQHAKKVLKTAAKTMGSKYRGYAPANVMELIENILRPATVDWTEIFASMVARYVDAKRQRGYSRISNQRAAMAKHLTMRGQRHLGSRVPLFPGITKVFCYRIAWVVDTSGSMGTADLQAAMSELQQLLRKCPGLEVYLIYADAAVQSWQEIRAETDIDFNMKGRGGTDFDPALAYIVEKQKEGFGVDMVVYATDGECTAPTTRIDVPTLWLITPGRNERPVTTAAGNMTIFMRPYDLGEHREAA